MSQVLEGNYYQATPHGYVNRGKQVIKFASKINHLPIHSRCHQLLRSESHPLIIQKHERLQEVHCFFKSHENKKSESRFKLSLEKMRRSGQNEAEGLKNISSKIQYANNQTPRYKQEPVCNDNTQNPESVDKKLIHPQINKVGQQKNIFMKNGKQNMSELKNPLKQTISLMSLEKQESQKSNKIFKINTPKTALHKNVKEKNQTIRTESEDGEITEHAVYQVPPMKHIEHHKSQQKILDELSKLLRKVGKMQQKIRKSEQDFEKTKINEQIKQTQKELIKLQEQNSRLKNGTTKCQNECSYSNIGNSGNLHLFIMFLFGLIFAKAVFC